MGSISQIVHQHGREMGIADEIIYAVILYITVLRHITFDIVMVLSVCNRYADIFRSMITSKTEAFALYTKSNKTKERVELLKCELADLQTVVGISYYNDYNGLSYFNREKGLVYLEQGTNPLAKFYVGKHYIEHCPARYNEGMALVADAIVSDTDIAVLSEKYMTRIVRIINNTTMYETKDDLCERHLAEAHLALSRAITEQKILADELATVLHKDAYQSIRLIQKAHRMFSIEYVLDMSVLFDDTVFAEIFGENIL